MKYAIVKFLDEIEQTPCFDEFLPRYVQSCATDKKGSSICTEQSPLNRFSEFAGNPRIGEITVDFADRWRGHLLSRYSNNYVRSCLATMRSFFAYAVGIGVVTINPFLAVKLPRADFGGRLLTTEEIKGFLPLLPLEERRMCLLALATGMRRMEIVDLDKTQVFSDYIFIPKHKSKSGKERIVSLHPADAMPRILKPQIESTSTADRKVFHTSAHKLNERVTAAWKRLGVGQIRFHDLRHTFATRYYDKTKDLFALMRQCGWSSIQSAARYKHEDPKNKPASVDLGLGI